MAENWYAFFISIVKCVSAEEAFSQLEKGLHDAEYNPALSSRKNAQNMGVSLTTVQKLKRNTNYEQASLF